MRPLVLVLLLLAVVAAGWSALWFYAAHEAGTQLDAWMKAEDGQGRAWRCPGRAIGGYPFAVTIACSKPSYTGRTPEQTVQGDVAGLVAEASLAHPKTLVVALKPPLTYRTSDGQADVRSTWSQLTVDLDGIPDVRTVALHGTEIKVTGSFGETGERGGNAASLDAAFTVSRIEGAPMLDFIIATRGSAMPPVDALLGGEAAPVDIDLAGRLDHPDAAVGPTPEEAIDAWRRAGGRVDLASSTLTRGDSKVNGAGALQLDEAHRPQGRIDASFVGLEPVLKRYGINGNIAAAGSLLTSLFGGGGQPKAKPDVPGALNLPISFKDGRIGVGPIRTQIAVPALY